MRRWKSDRQRKKKERVKRKAAVRTPK
jgi:hypothetical protein